MKARSLEDKVSKKLEKLEKLESTLKPIKFI